LATQPRTPWCSHAPLPPAERAVTSEIWKMECDRDDVSLADVLPVVLRPSPSRGYRS
jgi:hypothetical protein